MTISRAIVVCLLVTGCTPMGANNETAQSEHNTSEVWFAGHRNSKLASYHRIRTDPIRYDGRNALHTVNDTFRRAKNGDGFILARTIEEWTELDGRLIRLQARILGEMNVEVKVHPEELVYSTQHRNNEMEHTRAKVPRRKPIYGTFHGFLLSTRFKAGRSRPGLKYDFIEANPYGRNPLPHTLEGVAQDSGIPAGTFEFRTHKGIRVGVTRDFEIQRITYSRTSSVFASSKPDVKLEGGTSPAQLKSHTNEAIGEPEESNKPDAGEGR